MVLRNSPFAGNQDITQEIEKCKDIQGQGKEGKGIKEGGKYCILKGDNTYSIIHISKRI